MEGEVLRADALVTKRHISGSIKVLKKLFGIYMLTVSKIYCSKEENNIY